MKERPIIFNAEMVRAILDGRKTQTRRIVTPQPINRKVGMVNAGYCGHPELWLVDGDVGSYTCNGLIAPEWRCPFGIIGDRLWVRETFQGPLMDESLLDDYRKDADKFQNPKYCEYAADGGEKPEYTDLDDNLRYGWRPSIHMPRWASRINLQITKVRVERLNGISEADALAEGCVALEGCKWHTFEEAKAGTPMHDHTAKDAFSALWQSIYGEESWSSNPWVWVIEFERVEGGAA